MSCPHCGAAQRPGVIRVRRPIVAILFALGLLLAYTLGGQLLHDLAEGMDRSRLDLWKLLPPLATLGLAVVAVFVRRQQPVCEPCPPRGLWEALPADTSARILSSEGASRRVALRTLGATGATVAAAAGGLGAAVLSNRKWVPVGRDFFRSDVEFTAQTPRDEWAGARIRNYRRLGRTNAMVSDISLGAGRIGADGLEGDSAARAVDLARAAIERGVNYFDTSPDYSGNNSEHILGKAIQGQRDKMFLATKFCLADGHL